MHISEDNTLINTGTRETAALKIQTAWRSYKSKQKAKRSVFQTGQLYGMEIGRRIIAPNRHTQSILELYKDEFIKKRYDSEYLRLMLDERTRLLQERGPQIMEDISDHVRAWLKEL